MKGSEGHPAVARLDRALQHLHSEAGGAERRVVRDTQRAQLSASAPDLEASIYSAHTSFTRGLRSKWAETSPSTTHLVYQGATGPVPAEELGQVAGLSQHCLPLAADVAEDPSAATRGGRGWYKRCWRPGGQGGLLPLRSATAVTCCFNKALAHCGNRSLLPGPLPAPAQG